MTTAFVLGGGGVLGATQVGMLQGLLEADITPDMVIGTSIGAVNGAFIAQDPTREGVDALAELWADVITSGVFLESPVRQAARLARHRTHLLSPQTLPDLIDLHLDVEEIGDLQVPFQCVAAQIESAASHWFSSGPVVPAVAASCAVPGLFAPVEIDGRHYLDGGLVHSIPVGRAIDLGASRIYVLQVGRVEQSLTPPKQPWEVGLVAFEIARRHRFVEEIAAVPDGIDLHVLPSGGVAAPAVVIRQGRDRRVSDRIDAGLAATRAYLDAR